MLALLMQLGEICNLKYSLRAWAEKSSNLSLAAIESDQFTQRNETKRSKWPYIRIEIFSSVVRINIPTR
jgi:hypothetical protein